MSNPELRGLWSKNIGYIGNRERLESAFNKKHLLVINPEPQLHRLWLQIIGYVGSQERFESTFLKNYLWIINPNPKYADFDHKVFGKYTVVKGSSRPFKNDTYG